VREVYFRCAKAIVRANLWEQEALVDRSIMPSLVKILMDQMHPGQSKGKIGELEQTIAHRLQATLY